MHPAPKRSHRWFQFSLATVFVIISGVAIWLGMEANAVHRRASLLRHFEANRAEIIYTSIGGNMALIRFGDPDEEPSYVRELMGDSYVMTIIFRELPTPEQIADAQAFPEADICYFNPAIP